MSSALCPCGCALAAWSMPWPVTSGGAAPWAAAAVHEHAPTPHTYALFSPSTADPELIDPIGLDEPDRDLIDTHLIEPEES